MAETGRRLGKDDPRRQNRRDDSGVFHRGGRLSVAVLAGLTAVCALPWQSRAEPSEPAPVTAATEAPAAPLPEPQRPEEPAPPEASPPVPQPPPPAPESVVPVPPPETTSEPPVLEEPPSQDALRPPVEAVRSALNALPCALLAVEALNGRLLVSGTVAGEATLPTLHAALDRSAAGWEHGLDVAVAAPGLCAPLNLLAAPLAANTALPAPLRVKTSGPGRLHGGDPLVLDLLAPAAPVHLRIDYFTTDGNVVHLLPNPLEPGGHLDAGAARSLGERSAGSRFWSVGPPFGQELIVALATPSPLFGTARPELEPAAVYLADLKRALAAVAPGTPPVAAALFIATAP
ncbi:DUF4384 domain-containing protein [Azospirillum doebereinerae]|uniref:DUF4384 domain-containing protein n=1 Tax=Azospirillum doebereinerae TaxID=92933 RepID=A0A3S1CD86_9PROT|nr:DUF4384 domain-containing protein [Azospirillum doebereinerae]RUQ62190.1 DUF4384 domain-containing protein [Azospirillum doebereinerae]